MLGTDYPTPREPATNAMRIQLDSKLLDRAVSRVHYSLSQRAQPHLQGVRIETEEGLLRTMVINNYSVAICTVDVEGLAGGWGGLIPSTALRLFTRLCEDSERVTLLSDGPHVFIENDDTLLASLTPQGDFPPWRNLLTHLGRRPVARVSCQMLQEALRAVTAARESEASSVRLTVHGSELLLALERDDSEARDCLAIEPLGEQDYTVLVDPVLLTAIARGADSDFALERAEPGPLISTDDGYLATAARRRDDPQEEGGQRPLAVAARRRTVAGPAPRTAAWLW